MMMQEAEATARVTYRRYNDQQRGPQFCDECGKEVPAGAISVLATMPSGNKIEPGWLCPDCAKKENV
jgi:hypothetical protein